MKHIKSSLVKENSGLLKYIHTHTYIYSVCVYMTAHVGLIPLTKKMCSCNLSKNLFSFFLWNHRH